MMMMMMMMMTIAITPYFRKNILARFRCSHALFEALCEVRGKAQMMQMGDRQGDIFIIVHVSRSPNKKILSYLKLPGLLEDDISTR